jgi:hypothetical protein
MAITGRKMKIYTPQRYVEGEWVDIPPELDEER